MSLRILAGGLDDPRVDALLRTHVAGVRSSTARGSAHALDPDGLRAPDIAFWTGWMDNAAAGCAALKRLSAGHGEVKSMHVAEAWRRHGVGAELLAHLIAAARAGGVQRLSLQTGSWPYFSPAHAFYRRAGFVECAPFEGYVEDRHSLFFTACVGRL